MLDICVCMGLCEEYVCACMRLIGYVCMHGAVCGVCVHAWGCEEYMCS